MSWRLRVIGKEVRYFKLLPGELWHVIRPGPIFPHLQPLTFLGFVLFWFLALMGGYVVHAIRVGCVSIGVLFTGRHHWE